MSTIVKFDLSNIQLYNNWNVRIVALVKSYLRLPTIRLVEQLLAALQEQVPIGLCYIQISRQKLTDISIE